MTMKSLFQTMALPTGGLRRWRCSSTQALRLKGASLDMGAASDGIERPWGSRCEPFGAEDHFRLKPNTVLGNGNSRANGPAGINRRSVLFVASAKLNFSWRTE